MTGVEVFLLGAAVGSVLAGDRGWLAGGLLAAALFGWEAALFAFGWSWCLRFGWWIAAQLLGGGRDG